MIRQFSKFFVNGAVLGVVSWALQALIYRGIGKDSSSAYGVATALTYVPLVVVNFLIQRRWIFKQDGLFWRFVVANLSIMLLVSIVSPLFRILISQFFGTGWGDVGGFATAAVLMAVPSFFLKRYFVFNS